MTMWDTFESRLVIQAELKATTALRVGAGGDDAAHPAASDLPVLVGADSRPYIPGSSLRGVVRSQIERIVRTLEPQAGEGQGACHPTEESRWCIPASKLNGDDGESGWRAEARGREDGEAWLAKQIWTHSCRVCLAFGNAWLASRVRIADLHLHPESDFMIERRDGVAIDRDKETVQHKYDFEILPRDTSFQLLVLGENLSAHERGLLWLGVRELIDGHVLIGGFKGRGLGHVTLTNLKIEGVDSGDKQAMRQYILHGDLKEISNREMDQWLEKLLDELGLGE